MRTIELFLTSAEAHFEREQQELMVRMNRLRPFLNILGASSGVLMLIMAGLWVWRGWNQDVALPEVAYLVPADVAATPWNTAQR